VLILKIVRVDKRFGRLRDRRRPGRASPAPTDQRGIGLRKVKIQAPLWRCLLIDFFGGLVAEDAEAAFQIVLDEFKFFRGIAGSVLEGGGRQALIETADALKGFHTGADEDFAAIAGIAKALDEAGFFEAVEDAGDGAGGQTGMAGDVTGGKGALGITGHQFKASGISNIDAESGGNSLMEKDGGSAELAAEFHADADDQGVALAGGGRPAEFIQLDAVHFILTPNYLTN